MPGTLPMTSSSVTVAATTPTVSSATEAMILPLGTWNVCRLCMSSTAGGMSALMI